jgi:thioredoxin 1
MSDNGAVLALDEAKFKTEILGGAGVALVDFWAPWCGPCHLIAPTVAKLAKSYAGRLTVGKLDIDEHPSLAGSLGITAIPTLLLFRGGKLVDRIVGVVTEDALTKRIEKQLAETKEAGAAGA